MCKRQSSYVQKTGQYAPYCTFTEIIPPASTLFPIRDSEYIHSVQSFSRVWLFATPWTEHVRVPCPSPTPGAYSNSCPWSRWGHPAISSSVVPFSSWLQSFPASGSFQMSQIFPLGGQSIRVSASASVLPMNIQDWLPLGQNGWISLYSKGL